MHLKNYAVTVRNDTGKAIIRLVAGNLIDAVALVAKAEGCPPSAIIEAKEENRK